MHNDSNNKTTGSLLIVQWSTTNRTGRREQQTGRKSQKGRWFGTLIASFMRHIRPIWCSNAGHGPSKRSRTVRMLSRHRLNRTLLVVFRILCAHSTYHHLLHFARADCDCLAPLSIFREPFPRLFQIQSYNWKALETAHRHDTNLPFRRITRNTIGSKFDLDLHLHACCSAPALAPFGRPMNESWAPTARRNPNERIFFLNTFAKLVSFWEAQSRRNLVTSFLPQFVSCVSFTIKIFWPTFRLFILCVCVCVVIRFHLIERMEAKFCFFFFGLFTIFVLIHN